MSAMPSSHHPKRILLPLMALYAATLLGCATLGKPAEELVAERAQQRLDALLDQDFETAYGYLSPGYRSSVSLANWQAAWLMRRVVWNSATVTGSECSEDVCKVMVSLRIGVERPVPGVSDWEGGQEIKEDWARIDGDWYLVP